MKKSDAPAFFLVIDLEATSVAAPWNTEGDWGEQPPSLRYHQFYDASGTVTVDGTAYPFAGPGFRSHSRRRRDMPGFTGHAIINGRFPSGRGFGLLRYRATADRPERGGYRVAAVLPEHVPGRHLLPDRGDVSHDASGR